MSDGTIHSGFLDGAALLIRDLGAEPDALAEACGLPRRALAEDGMVLPGRPVLAFLEMAAEVCGAPDFALQMAVRRGGLQMLGPVWVVMSAAATVGEALGAGASNLGFRMTTITARVLREADLWTLEMDTSASGARDVQAIEFALALVALQARAWLGAGWRPLATQFRHAAHGERGAYAAVFGHTVQFDQDRSAVVFDPIAWSTPLPTANTRARTVLGAALRRERRADRGDLVRRVRQLLKAGLPDGRVGLGEMARDIGVPARTLQHRLRQEGATFHGLLDSVRVEMAVRYLQSSVLTGCQIAEMLQFADGAAFSRFIRRQTGRSPRQIRRDAPTAPGGLGLAAP